VAVDDKGLEELRPLVLAARRDAREPATPDAQEGSGEPRRGAPVGRGEVHR